MSVSCYSGPVTLVRLTLYKLTSSKVILLLAGLLMQQGTEAQTETTLLAQSATTAPNVLPGYVTNKAVPEAEKTAATATVTHKGYVAGDFLATTTGSIEGYTILDYKGLVEGAAVRVPTWNEDAAAGTQEVYGGSIASYAQLCEEARIQAFNTMVERAKNLGANAVIGIHFDSQVMPLDKGKFASGVVCVGTAIVAKHKNSL